MISLPRLALLCLLALTWTWPAGAGTLGKADIERRFQRPLHVADKLREIPAWPLTSELTPDAGPVAYAFESVDLAPIPGFEGTPINLLVVIDKDGRFLEVEVLHQHEPVFLGGLGPVPLMEFVRQYKDKSLKQEITVASTYGSARADAGGDRVVLDGVAKATASVRIVNQTVLAAALAVARVRLGVAAASELPPARVKELPFAAMDFAALQARGYVQTMRLSNAEIETLFAGSEGAGVDTEVLRDPDGPFMEIHVAYLNPPLVGRNLLGEAAFARLRDYLRDEQPAFWIATRGRYGLVDEGFVPGTVPPRLALRQNGLPVELRDANRDYAALPAPPGSNAALILVAPALAGLDPGQPMEFRLSVARSKGMILPTVTRREINLRIQPPAELLDYPPRPLPEWLRAWRDRWPDLALIGAALALLVAVLARPQWISREPGRLLAFRLGFLAFTLGFIGWHAQGQLSIVQLTGAIKSLVAGAGLKSFLYDPVSLLLIVFTLLSLAVWGRGVFCGWLCPYGALQELVGLAAKKLGLRQLGLAPRPARLLARSRYVVLAVLAGSAALAPAAAERMVEIEPFKTAITVGFVREWPYVAWAVGLLLAGTLVYKFFCRYLCPLGAALTLGGRLRRWNWLPRLPVCGQPCRKCEIVCQYDAIRRDGAIDYDECHQCLDCVGLYHDERRCGPQLLQARKGRTIPIRPLPAGRLA